MGLHSPRALPHCRMESVWSGKLGSIVCELSQRRSIELWRVWHKSDQSFIHTPFHPTDTHTHHFSYFTIDFHECTTTNGEKPSKKKSPENTKTQSKPEGKQMKHSKKGTEWRRRRARCFLLRPVASKGKIDDNFRINASFPWHQTTECQRCHHHHSGSN